VTIGAINKADGKPSSYDCCIQVSEVVRDGSGDVNVRELPGGRYAILTLAKDTKIAGSSISRFFQVYVPENKSEVDGTRPTYEIYYENKMEFCVPIL
jgi:DNA gyrase inhibitor GyrI